MKILLNLKGAQKLTKNEQVTIFGGGVNCGHDTLAEEACDISCGGCGAGDYVNGECSCK